jgi:acyl-CoA synthetase (AMP-forming)/AMP-acid ligase II
MSEAAACERSGTSSLLPPVLRAPPVVAAGPTLWQHVIARPRLLGLAFLHVTGRFAQRSDKRRSRLFSHAVEGSRAVIFTSPYPSVEIPDVTLYEYLFGGLTDEELSRIAIIDGGTTLTYRELRDRIDAFAGALAAKAIKPGDVVALHAPNGAGFVIAFHGILRAGATATTINSLYTAAEIASQLADSHAVLYVTVSVLLPAAKPGAEQCGLGTDKFITLDPVDGYESLGTLLAQKAPAPSVDIDPTTHLAVLPYSSGTTGRAKGVMLTHRNLVANVCQSLPMLGIGPRDTVLAVLPFFHIYGMNVLMSLTLRERGTLVTMPRFDLAEFLRLIQEHKCTFLFIAPPMAVALTKHPMVDQFDLSSVRAVVSGAAPLDEALGEALAAKLGTRILQGYGMTELSPVSHVTPLSGPALPIGSIGHALPNIEFKIVDPGTGAERTAAPGGETETGELWVRGPNVMVGYLGNSAATADTIDSDGFLHTGDIAKVGPRQEVYVVDRLKELIKYKGYQVPPAELEALLLTHPLIADAAVVAQPDEEGGEIPRAFVVLQAGATMSADEVIDFVAARVAPHKKVRMVDFIDLVPKSASGKILRKDLKGRPVTTAAPAAEVPAAAPVAEPVPAAEAAPVEAPASAAVPVQIVPPAQETVPAPAEPAASEAVATQPVPEQKPGFFSRLFGR